MLLALEALPYGTNTRGITVIELKPGDRVTYFKRDRNKTIYVATKYPARVVSVGKQRVTIELEDGKRKIVEADSLERVTP